MRGDENVNDENLRRRVLEKACELAFGRSNDTVKLAYLSEKAIGELDGLDLSALSSIHRAANGAVELKMTDRLKLIELLLGATEGGRNEPTGGEAELISALNHAAERLSAGGEADEGGAS